MRIRPYPCKCGAEPTKPIKQSKGLWIVKCTRDGCDAAAATGNSKEDADLNWNNQSRPIYQAYIDIDSQQDSLELLIKATLRLNVDEIIFTGTTDISERYEPLIGAVKAAGYEVKFIKDHRYEDSEDYKFHCPTQNDDVYYRTRVLWFGVTKEWLEKPRHV